MSEDKNNKICLAGFMACGKSTVGRCLASRLGCRFLPYASGAALPELMLGRWLVAREQLWPLLADAYLPLARAGYPLDSQKIESDVNDLLTGSLKALYL